MDGDYWRSWSKDNEIWKNIKDKEIYS